MTADWLTRVDLPPDVFAVVMATAIVSISADDHGYPSLSVPLGVLAVMTFALLSGGLALRITDRPGSALGELRDPDVTLRLFTSVASCAVLGMRFNNHPVAVWLLGTVALVAWLLLVPLAARDVRARTRADLRDHAHGAWLLPSVATSGLAGTAANLAVHSRLSTLAVLGAVGWVLSIVFYLVATWLIVWRALAVPFLPDEVTPDSWILMGALAIATLAGGHLLSAADSLGGLEWLSDIARPLMLGTWVAASLWIPVLLCAAIWRVDQRAGSLRYAGVWWSAVFPLGMYSAATAETSGALRMHPLATVSLVFFWLAFAAWLLVAIGGVHLAWASSRRAGRGPTRRADLRPDDAPRSRG